MSDPRPGRLLVDGSNVMGSRPDGWWRDRRAARRRLVRELEDARAAALAAGGLPDAAAVVVVFDGREHDLPTQHVEARFVPHADDLLAALAGPGDVVVTSDRELVARATAAGARAVGAGRLVRALAG